MFVASSYGNANFMVTTQVKKGIFNHYSLIIINSSLECVKVLQLLVGHSSFSTILRVVSSNIVGICTC